MKLRINVDDIDAVREVLGEIRVVAEQRAELFEELMCLPAGPGGAASCPRAVELRRQVGVLDGEAARLSAAVEEWVRQ